MALRSTKAVLADIDRLLLEEPRSALSLAEDLLAGAKSLDRDSRVHVFSSIGVAQLKLGQERAARESYLIAASTAQGSRAGVRSLVKLLSAAIETRVGRYEVADRELEAALDLAQVDPIGSILGRVRIQHANLAFRRGDYLIAAERYGLAMSMLPRGSDYDYLRAIAGWNLIVTTYRLDQRSVPKILRNMRARGLRCRTPRAKHYQRPTVPKCMVCWMEGYLHSLLGHHSHANRCLGWAAESLWELGALREATLCALDLAALELDDADKAIPIVGALASDPEAPKAVRRAATEWAKSPAAAHADPLRAYLLEYRKASRSFV